MSREGQKDEKNTAREDAEGIELNPSRSETLFPAAAPQVDGVLLSALVDFVSKCGGSDKLKGMSTRQVVEQFVKPMTAATGKSYCQQLQVDSSSAVGGANVFISHSWDDEFLLVMDSVHNHFKATSPGHENDLSSGTVSRRSSYFRTDVAGGPRLVIVWMDVFCINHHAPQALLKDERSERGAAWSPLDLLWCQGFATIVLAMPSWTAATVLGRTWCLLEIYQSLLQDEENERRARHSGLAGGEEAAGRTLEIAMGSSAQQQFFEGIIDSVRSITQDLPTKCNFLHSGASSLPDKQALQGWVDRSVGFHGFDTDVFGQVRDWVVSVTKAKWEAVQDEETRMGLQKALAGLYHDSGRFDEAKPLFERVLQHRRATLGDTHAKTLGSLIGLANVDFQRGAVDEALAKYTEAYEARKGLQGEDNVDTVYCLNGMANCYARKERYDQAEKCYEKCLRFRRTHLGIENPETRQTLNNLASLYFLHSHFVKAEPRLLECLKVNTAAIGRDGRDTLVSMQNLGTMYYMQEKYDLALPLIQECLELREKHKRREEKAELRQLKGSAGASKGSAGAAALGKSVHGISSRTTLELLNLLGRCHMQLWDYYQAEEVLTECYDGFVARYGADDEVTLNLHRTLQQIRTMHTLCAPFAACWPAVGVNKSRRSGGTATSTPTPTPTFAGTPAVHAES